MGSSITLFKLFGIEMRVHWSFLLIVVYQAFVYSNATNNRLVGALYGVLMILLLFVCVTLHELGHALAAQYYKVNVPHITLLPIGGVASLERMPDRPFQELVIAVAGPLVNVAIAILLAPFAAFALVSAVGDGAVTLTLSALWRYTQTPGWGTLIVGLLLANILLALFNLLPAFPMDGGRILRALLAMTLPYVHATRIAVMVGRLMAVLFAIWGLTGGGIFLLLIAFFVYIGGGAELESVESRAVLKTVRAVDALTRSAVSLYASEQVNRAVELVMSSYQIDYPVLDLSSRFTGVLTRARLVYALKEIGPDARIVDVMIPSAEVPSAPPQETLDKIWEVMIQSGSRVVAIKDNQTFLGLLTLDDISEVFQVIGAKLDGKSQRQPPTQNAESTSETKGALNV
jgi:stage IV sporulation protein FB